MAQEFLALLDDLLIRLLAVQIVGLVRIGLQVIELAAVTPKIPPLIVYITPLTQRSALLCRCSVTATSRTGSVPTPQKVR